VNEVVGECDKLRHKWSKEKEKKAHNKDHAEKKYNSNELQSVKEDGSKSEAENKDEEIVHIFNVVKRILVNFEPDLPQNDHLANEWLKRCDFVSNHSFRTTRKQRFHDEVELKNMKKYCSELVKLRRSQRIFKNGKI
jgi:hypothetical protein